MIRKIIVGLGNPGEEYKNTRHNVGWLFLDQISDADLPWQESKEFLCTRADRIINGKPVALIKPQTFMNDSGRAVQGIVNFYELDPSNVIVIHDDKDIRFGEWRIQRGRGPAGHNGVRSIIEALGTRLFTRVRIGVAPPLHDRAMDDTTDFVLADFTEDEQQKLGRILKAISSELHSLV